MLQFHAYIDIQHHHREGKQSKHIIMSSTRTSEELSSKDADCRSSCFLLNVEVQPIGKNVRVHDFMA